MSSNLTVLHQYAIAIPRMSTEVLHSVFGRELFPSGAVNDVVPVPRVSGVTSYGSYGPLATPGWSGWTRFVCTPGPGVPGSCHYVVRGRPVGGEPDLHRLMLDLVVG